jgi:hypothetical protein
VWAAGLGAQPSIEPVFSTPCGHSNGWLQWLGNLLSGLSWFGRDEQGAEGSKP